MIINTNSSRGLPHLHPIFTNPSFQFAPTAGEFRGKAFAGPLADTFLPDSFEEQRAIIF
jgi:hypothetical protein